MKPGDLVRIVDDMVSIFHDPGLSDYTLAGSGEVVMVVEPNSRLRVRDGGLFAKVLHPTVGVCYISKKRLEVVDESTTTICPAMQLTAGCGITPSGGGHETG